MHINKVTLHPQQYPTGEYYPFSLKIFQDTLSLDFAQPVTFFVGENGSGKSTLLKAICQSCGIHIWEDNEHSRFLHNPYEAELCRYIDVAWVDGPVPGSFFSSQIFHDFARYLDEWARVDPGMLQYFGGNSLLTQSHGESFISFFTSRYTRKGLYFMDEPETALSPQSQLKLLKVLKDMSAGGHAQFIITSHSPILLAYPDAVLYDFNCSPIVPVAYRDTQYYRIYRDFINNQDKFLQDL